MAWDTNNVTLIGRLTRDPEMAYTGNNTPVCKFSIANNRGSNPDEVNFFDITTWNKTATLCSQSLHKGSRIAVEGKLRQERFQDKSGQNRSKVTITANTIQFLDPRSDSDSPSVAGQNRASTHVSSSSPKNDTDIDFENISNETMNNDEEVPF